MPRALILALALVVSPLGATLCEVVCGQPVPTTTAVTAAVDEHAHHGHHAAPQTVVVSIDSAEGRSMSIPAPDCDLRGAVPARLRAASADLIASAAAMTTSAYQLVDAPARRGREVRTTSSPPSPPPLTSLPLRI